MKRLSQLQAKDRVKDHLGTTFTLADESQRAESDAARRATMTKQAFAAPKDSPAAAGAAPAPAPALDRVKHHLGSSISFSHPGAASVRTRLSSQLLFCRLTPCSVSGVGARAGPEGASADGDACAVPGAEG